MVLVGLFPLEVLFQPEVPEHQLLAVLSVPVPRHHIRLCRILCCNLCCIHRNWSLEHSMAGKNHSCVQEHMMLCSLAQERRMAGMYHSLVLVCCRHWHSDVEQHNGGSGGENHND